MIETSDMQFEERMVTPREVEEDHEAEVTLRPQTLVEYIGQDKVKEIWRYILRRQNAGEIHWIMYCSTALPVLAKQRCPRLLPTKWALICV